MSNGRPLDSGYDTRNLTLTPCDPVIQRNLLTDALPPQVLQHFANEQMLHLLYNPRTRAVLVYAHSQPVLLTNLKQHCLQSAPCEAVIETMDPGVYVCVSTLAQPNMIAYCPVGDTEGHPNRVVQVPVRVSHYHP